MRSGQYRSKYFSSCSFANGDKSLTCSLLTPSLFSPGRSTIGDTSSWTSGVIRYSCESRTTATTTGKKEKWIEGVELIHRFLQHLLPPGFRHIRRYGWMGPRVKPEKRDFIRSYHGLDDVPASESQDEADGEAAREEEVSTQTCRFCAGDMHLTGSTVRPRVSELLAMPLSRFRQAQAGFTVTLGDRLPQIEAKRCGDESAPVMGERAQQIRKQLSALMNSSYL